MGKSTLFNRLLERRQAIEDRASGVTRDRLYGKVEWSGSYFTLIDTGGLNLSPRNSLEDLVQRQVQFALEEAHLVLMVVDVREQVTSLDQEIAAYLRKQGKEVLLVANKLDPGKKDWQWYDFYQLGLGDPLPVSASHGRGIGELLDEVLERLPPEEEEAPLKEDAIRVAVVGRPNVGKSLLVNHLLQEERAIVSDEPGTTRDYLEVKWNTGEKPIVLVDTAGLRKKSRIKKGVEFYSVVRSLKAIDRADVAVVLVDAVQGVTEQDKKIMGYVVDAGKGLVVAVNKWDLMRNQGTTVDDFLKRAREQLYFVSFAPFLFISALTGWRVQRLQEKIWKVEEERRKRVGTSLLNQLLQDSLMVNPPPSRRGSKVNFYYATQPEIQPPTFVIFVNEPELVPDTYLRYLENRLRESFGFEGVPLRIKVKKKE